MARRADSILPPHAVTVTPGEPLAGSWPDAAGRVVSPGRLCFQVDPPNMTATGTGTSARTSMQTSAAVRIGPGHDARGLPEHP